MTYYVRKPGKDRTLVRAGSSKIRNTGIYAVRPEVTPYNGLSDGMRNIYESTYSRPGKTFHEHIDEQLVCVLAGRKNGKSKFYELEPKKEGDEAVDPDNFDPNEVVICEGIFSAISYGINRSIELPAESISTDPETENDYHSSRETGVYKCHCPLDLIMKHGCKCGGI